MIRPKFIAAIAATCFAFAGQSRAEEIIVEHQPDDDCVTTVTRTGPTGTYLVRETRRLKTDTRVIYVDERHRHRHATPPVTVGLILGYPAYRYNNWYGDNRYSYRRHSHNRRHHSYRSHWRDHHYDRHDRRHDRRDARRHHDRRRHDGDRHDDRRHRR